MNVLTRLGSFHRAVVLRINSRRITDNSHRRRMKRNNSASTDSTNSIGKNNKEAREQNQDDPLLLSTTNEDANISSYGATTAQGKEAVFGIKGEIEPPPMTNFAIIAVLSTSFSCSCLLTTFFIVVAPIECQRIQTETTELAQFYQTDGHDYSQNHGHNVINKSIALGGFAAVAGFAQLIKPIIGLLSDCYSTALEKRYKNMYKTLDMLGKRMPYLILGTFMVVVGVFGQMWTRSPIHTFVTDNNGGQSVMGGAWIQYSIFLLITMFGSNIVYTIMIVLIPDLVPPSQTGVANGTLALLVVSGALFGFFMFDILENSVMGMYQIYIITSSLCAMLTFMYVFERENILKSVKVDAMVVINNDNYYCNRINTIEGEEESQRIQSMSARSENVVTHDSETVETQSNRLNGTINVASTKDHQKRTQEQGNETENESLNLPPLHTLMYILLYEPIMNKSRSEVAAAYWIDTKKHRDFFIVTVSRFFYYMGVSSQTFFLYYIHDILRQSARTANPEAAIVLLAIVGQSSGAITCYPVGVLSDEYMGGRRKPFVYAACILLALGNVGLLFCDTLTDMIGVCALLGAANGMYLTMDTSLAVDTLNIDEEVVSINNDGSMVYGRANDEERGNSRKEDMRKSTNIDFDEEVKAMLSESKKKERNHNHGAAQLLGVWGVFGFVGSALGPLIGGTALLFFGKIAKNSDTNDTSTDSTASNDIFPSSPFYKFQGYEVLYSLSAFYFFCSALSLALVRKKGV